MKLTRDPFCTRCRLCQTAEHVCLLGHGPTPCDIMIIGEVPGYGDGIPPQSKSDYKLDDTLEDNGLKRSEVYITYAVHCRPPDKKAPTKAQIRECRYWLEKEIEVVNPKYVLLLGNTALEAVTGKKGIKNHRGKAFELEGRIFYPAYNPSYVLYDPKQDRVFKGDIKSFKRMIDKGGLYKETGSNQIIVDRSNLAEALADIRDSKVLSYDTETSGLNPFAEGAWVTSLGVCTRHAQWCFPLNHWKGPIYEKKKAQTRLVQKVHDAVYKEGVKDKVTVAHNGKYDILFLLCCFGIRFTCVFDTMLAHYNLDENQFHGLKPLSEHYFDAPGYDIPLEWKWGIEGPLDKHCEYLGLDCLYTRKLYFIFKKWFEKDPITSDLFYNLTMGMSDLYIDVEFNGMPVNRERLTYARGYWESISKIKEKKIHELGGNFNIGSPQQLAEVLFDKLSLDVVEKTAGGARSTAESSLLQLAEHHEIARLVLDWREANKNLSTFVGPWASKIVRGRLHPSFLIHGTVTGRPSAKAPNPQQTARDPRIRAMIDEEDEDWIIVSADHSQVELRLAADASQDGEMLRTYQTGGDIHVLTVQRNFGIMEPTSEERKKGKAINFGYLYGMWWKKFKIYARDNFGLYFSDQEAQESRASWFRTYPGINDYHKRQRSYVNKNGYVRNKIGRKRRLNDGMRRDNSWECKSAERQAINSPIQSLASDINLAGAIEINKKLSKKDVKIISTTHDEILMAIRVAVLNKILPRIKKIMERPRIIFKIFELSLDVPLEVEIEIGPWGDHENNIKWKGQVITPRMIKALRKNRTEKIYSR